jgi:hypothetical protein
MSYTINTTFSFTCPEGVKYNAAVIKGKKIVSVNTDNSTDTYNSVDDWLKVIPGSPTIDKITITTPTKTVKRRKAAIVKITDTYGFNVPDPRNQIFRVSGYAKYIYEMIAEAAPQLLQDENVKNAYNIFVNYMHANSGYITSYYPTSITNYPPISMNHTIYYTAVYYSLTDKVLKETIANTIKQHFTALVQLLNTDVVSYVNAKHKAIVNKREIASLEKSIKKYEDKITQYQKDIVYCRERIAKLSG